MALISDGTHGGEADREIGEAAVATVADLVTAALRVGGASRARCGATGSRGVERVPGGDAHLGSEGAAHDTPSRGNIADVSPVRFAVSACGDAGVVGRLRPRMAGALWIETGSDLTFHSTA